MPSKPRYYNPYIAGRAVRKPENFFDREDIMRQVEAELSSREQNAIVLFGQRRIGKTSILLRLQRSLPSPQFVPVYFDLMDCARRPLGEVLFEIASTIATQTGMELLVKEDFDDLGSYFRRTFLPNLYRFLGEESDPVLLLDEFDVLDVATEDQLSPEAAARTFFPYLGKLLDDEPRLKFVFAVGRHAGELSINVKAAFKTALSHRVSVLDELSARNLITLAERQGSLTFAPDALERILALTRGHPYLTQLLCHTLWNIKHAVPPSAIPRVDIALVEDAATKSLEVGESIFEWIWDGLPPAERIICAATASATDEQPAVTEEQISRLLQSLGVRILTNELERAPKDLVEREMLRQTEGGYQFFIELMRRWIAKNRPLWKLKRELDRVEPLANRLYQSGEGYYQQGDAKEAKNLLGQALQRNPNHLKARLLLGQILLEQGGTIEAIEVLEAAHPYNDEARYPLARALQSRAKELVRKGDDAAALSIYQRVLELFPEDTEALAYQKKKMVERAQNCEQNKDWRAAIDIYNQLANDHPSESRWIKKVEELQQKQKMVLLAQNHERNKDWRAAIDIYRGLKVVYPHEPYWNEEAERVRMKLYEISSSNDSSAMPKIPWIPAFALVFFLVIGSGSLVYWLRPIVNPIDPTVTSLSPPPTLTLSQRPTSSIAPSVAPTVSTSQPIIPSSLPFTVTVLTPTAIPDRPTIAPVPTTVVPTTEVPTIEPTTEVPTIEPTTEVPTIEPTTEVPTIEPTTEVPTIEPTTEVPTIEPTTEVPTTEPTTEVPTTEPTTEVPTTEPTTEVPTIEPTTEVPITTLGPESSSYAAPLLASGRAVRSVSSLLHFLARQLRSASSPSFHRESRVTQSPFQIASNGREQDDRATKA